MKASGSDLSARSLHVVLAWHFLLKYQNNIFKKCTEIKFIPEKFLEMYFYLNFSRCLTKLVVLYDTTLHPPLQTLDFSRSCLASCYFETKLSSHYWQSEVADSKATIILSAHKCRLSQVTESSPNYRIESIWIYNVDRRHLSDIRWINYINIGPDTNTRLDLCHRY